MIGAKIRELRENNNILLRQLSKYLDIDVALLSRMERGERFFKKSDIISISLFFNHNSDELLTLWLADRIIKTISTEEFQSEALFLALDNLKKQQ